MRAVPWRVVLRPQVPARGVGRTQVFVRLRRPLRLRLRRLRRRAAVARAHAARARAAALRPL